MTSSESSRPLGEGPGDRRAGREEGAAERSSAPGSPALPPPEDMGPGVAPDVAPAPGPAVVPPAPTRGGDAAPAVAREGDSLRFS
ncbi:MAG TPA: hypothetical protein VIL69_09670, partial [Roseomonas sp.]